MKATLISTALLLLLAAAGAARASPGADELELMRQRMFTAMLARERNCKAYCEGEPVEGDAHTTECWGLFKVWCGPPASAPGEAPRHELSGLLCQGHWKSWAVSAPVGPSSASDAPSAPALVTLCEGAHKWFASRTSTCPHSGHVHKTMMGLLSAGEILNVMGVSGPSPQASALLAQVQRTPEQQHQQEGLRRYQEVAEELQRLGVPRTAAFSPGPARLSEGGRVFSLETRHHGFKVEARATKRLPPDSSPMKETFESLADEVDELLAPSWRDLLPAPPPPPPERGHGNGSFELLCNGQAAWLHGAVPCWGNFTVAGTRTWSPASSSSSSSSSTGDAKKPCGGKMMGGKGDMMHHRHSLRRLMSTPLHLTDSASLKTMERLPRSAATTQQQQEGGAREGEVWRTERMKAECDGLWSGVLGHSCMGVSTSHLEVTVQEDGARLHHQQQQQGSAAQAQARVSDDDDDDDDGDDEPAMSKWSICSGRQSVRFVHRDYVYGMVVACKGGSVLALNVTMDEAHA